MSSIKNKSALNNQKIYERVRKICEGELRPPQLILLMDFDQCAVEEHLARIVTNHYSYLYDQHVLEVAKKDLSYKGILALQQGYVGLNVIEFKHMLKQVAKSATPRLNFTNFVTGISEKVGILPVFVSSGLADLIDIYLTWVCRDRKKINCVASSFTLSDNKISCPDIVIGDQEKTEVVKAFRKICPTSKFLTLGHSNGDIPMVSAGDQGLRVCFDDSADLKKYADIVIPDWDWGKVLDICLENVEELR